MPESAARPPLREVLAPRNWTHLISVVGCRLVYGKHCPHIDSLGTFTERWIIGLPGIRWYVRRIEARWIEELTRGN